MSRVSERLSELSDPSKVMVAAGLASRLVSTFWLVRKGTEKTGFDYARVLDDGAVLFGPLKSAKRFEVKADAMALARRLISGRIQMTLVVISFDLENDNG